MNNLTSTSNQIVAEPILEKNRKIGNQTIQPVGKPVELATPDVMPNDWSSTPVASDSVAKPVLTAPRNDWQTIQPVLDPVVGDDTNAPPVLGGSVPAPETLPTWEDGYQTPPKQPVSTGLAEPLERNMQTPNQAWGASGAVDQVVGDNSLVENRLVNLLEDNSKYLQVARTGAKQTAAGRGLLNSSIAAGAGEVAAIQSALPIAQQDAQNYAQVGMNNANTQNRFRENQQTQNFSMERDAANAGYTQDNMLLQSDIVSREQQQAHMNQLATMDAESFITSQRDTLLQGFQSLNIDQEHQNRLAQTASEFAYQQEQARFSMASQFQSQYLDSSTALQNNWSMEIQAIYQNGEMTPAQQTNAVNIATERYNQQVGYLAAMYGEMGAWNVVAEQFPQSEDQIGQTGGNPATGGGDTGGGNNTGGNGNPNNPGTGGGRGGGNGGIGRGGLVTP